MHPCEKQSLSRELGSALQRLSIRLQLVDQASGIRNPGGGAGQCQWVGCVGVGSVQVV